MRTTTKEPGVTTLEEERTRLVAELRDLGQQVAVVCPGDLADLAEERMRLHDVARRRVAIERRLEVLRLAMERVDEGEYGYCTVCGRSISPGRLEVLPAATTCVAHAGRRPRCEG